MGTTDRITTSNRIRILVVEDIKTDAELEIRELKRAGFRVEHRVVETEPAYRSSLSEFRPDIILSDFSMPEFDGMDALSIARQTCPDTPFILVSGTIGEEYAIRALHSGATDYVLKSNIARLPAAVERALEESADHATKRKMERELQESEAGLRRAQAMADLSHVVTGVDGRFETWPDSLPAMLGIEPADMPKDTREWLLRLHPEDRAYFREKAIEAGRTGTRTQLEYRLRRGTDTWIHIRQVMEPLQDPGDEHKSVRWFNTLQDVTEQKVAEDRIRRLNRVYAMLSGINTLIVRVHDRETLLREACEIAVRHGNFQIAWIGMVDAVSHRVDVAAFCGGSSEFLETLRTRHWLDADEFGTRPAFGRALMDRKAVFSNAALSDPQIRYASDHEALGTRSLAVLPLMMGEATAGALCLYAGEAGVFDDEEQKLLLEVASDISFALENIQKERQLHYLAYYDPVTGLANRTLFQERLGQGLEVASRESRKLALTILDIERFKNINHTLGRQAGDALLRQIADRMNEKASQSARLARIGSDHFAIMNPDIQSAEAFARLSERRLMEVFGTPFRVGETEIQVAVKLGIALFPVDGADVDTLFANAEVALKRAKASGERYLFYTQAMNERVAEKLSLETKLRQAIEKEEFVLHYQPKVELETRRIVGVEALIRWQSPELGLVPPMKFIPLMEETGLILPVGSWALKRASLDHKMWVDQGLVAPRVAVNVSPIQLRQRDFVATMQEAIRGGVSPTCIDLEITETLIMEDVQGNIEKLNAVRLFGARIAIDDFGTGYSSLAYLAKLPVQSLKIDRSFIITMLAEPDTMTLVQMTISLAHSLNLEVVAEGVETEDQAKMLRLLRCDQMQGYLFSRPITFEAMSALLAQEARR